MLDKVFIQYMVTPLWVRASSYYIGYLLSLTYTNSINLLDRLVTTIIVMLMICIIHSALAFRIATAFGILGPLVDRASFHEWQGFLLEGILLLGHSLLLGQLDHNSLGMRVPGFFMPILNLRNSFKFSILSIPHTRRNTCLSDGIIAKYLIAFDNDCSNHSL
jgi:hypothetical protein